MVVYRRRWKSIFVSYSLVRHTQRVLMRIANVCVLFYFFERLWKFSVRLWAQFYRHKFVYAHIKCKQTACCYCCCSILLWIFFVFCTVASECVGESWIRIDRRHIDDDEWRAKQPQKNTKRSLFFCSTKLAKWRQDRQRKLIRRQSTRDDMIAADDKKNVNTNIINDASDERWWRGRPHTNKQ